MEEKEITKPEKVKLKSKLFNWNNILIFLSGAVLIYHLTLVNVTVQGASMMPTLQDGDKVLVNKIMPQIVKYDRFDIIVFEAQEDVNYIKRIIGIPGDHIEYLNDSLFINGKKYEEPYLTEYKNQIVGNMNLTSNFKLQEYLNQMVVPEGHYFVLGDNRLHSKDSRDPSVGFIPINKIIGKTEFNLSP